MEAISTHCLRPRLKAGSSASIAHLWVADSCFVAKIASSVVSKSTLSVFVSVKSLWSSSSSLLSYDRPHSASILILNASIGFASSGAALVTIVGGSGFSTQNPSTKVSVGGTQCRFSHWTSDSAIRCRISHGGLASAAFLISSGSQVSLGSPQFVIFPFLSISSFRQRSSPASGSVSLTVFGSSAGQWSQSQAARISLSTTASTTWISDSSLISKSCHGVVALMTVVASSSLKSASLTQMFSFLSPSMLALGTTNVAQTGSSVVLIAAAGFGITGMSASSRTGGSSCENSQWIAESCIMCKVSQGSLASSRVMVSIAVFTISCSSALSFNAVLVSSVLVTNSPTSGSVFASITGVNFGSQHYSAHVVFGCSSEEATEWMSTSSVVPKVPQGSKFGLLTAVSAQLKVSTLTNSFTFDLGVPAKMNSTNVPTTGATSAYILGSLFNTGTSLSFRVRISETSTSRTAWHSDSSLLVKTVSGSVSLVFYFCQLAAPNKCHHSGMFLQSPTHFKREECKFDSFIW